MVKLERYEDAEAALVDAHEILTDSLGRTHERTVAQIESLIELYAAWGKPDKAAEWQARLPETKEEPGSE